MIVLDQLERVIVTPPKCASTSLHATLCRPPWNGLYVLGPQGEGNEDRNDWIEKHTTFAPWDARRGYTMLCSIRNPFDRARSLFGHFLQYRKPDEGKTFVEFCDRLVNDPELFWFYRWTVADFLDKPHAIMPHRYLHVEQLSRDLGEADVPASVERLNVTFGEAATWPEWYLQQPRGDQAAELVRRWADEDFELGGYDRSICRS